MLTKHKTIKREYEKLFKSGVHSYKKEDYKASYNCFSSIANSCSKFKYDAKFYLAKQYENGLGISKNSNYQKAFEFYLDIYYDKPQNIKGIELLLAECVKKRLGDFKDDKKAFEFYLDLYSNVPECKSFARDNLIKCYNLGIGVSKDEEKFTYLKMKL
ncbi:hypothetical protein C2G38_2231980 [Gigaspora rosea]|uniref:Uncharacterized protein n=1 Tax=Gigaspora rosea TaxID=44941 RepID=A0A397TW01_9GLOM|nr:hypothetical protein C2G38_2231980 [Gigaspora rosea]